MALQSTAHTKHHIVCLEDCHYPIPKFSIPHTYKGYNTTTRDDVAPRLKDATIALVVIIPILPSDLDQCPNLKCVCITATGHGWLQQEEFRKRGVTVIYCPQSNTATVAEHAIALYFAARRKVVELHNLTMRTDEWAEKGSVAYKFGGYPLIASLETMVIMGYGHLGKAVEVIAKALGMKVLIAERKGVEQVREGNVKFEEGLKRATVIVLTVPKVAETIDMIDEAELKAMKKEAILINVARGGVVNEFALVKALREGWIRGAATDVFDEEPPKRGVSPLLDDSIPNLTVSPHIAWMSEQTVRKLQGLAKEGVEGYVEGKPVNVVVKGWE